MVKILLDPGHGRQNRGFVRVSGYPYCNEGEANHDYAINHLKPTLERWGFIVGVTKSAMREDPSLATRGKKGRGYDLLLSLHSNAGGAVGTEIWDSTNPKESAPDLARALSAAIARAIGTVDRGVKYRKSRHGSNYYGILRHGYAKRNMIIEHAFHDSSSDAAKYVKAMPKIAEATARVLAEYYHVKAPDGVVDGIRDERTPLIAPPSADILQVKAWAEKKTNNAEFIDLADLYFDLFPRAGLDPVIGFAQMAHETGFLYAVKSAAGIDASYHNPCGLKITKGGGDYQASAHMQFASWVDGVKAHRDHLALYAGVKGYPVAQTPDPRHFPYLLGIATTLEDLSGKWAPSALYASKIKKYVEEIRAMEKVDTQKPDEEKRTEPKDYAREAWEWAKENGITDGSRPGDPITREDAVTLLYRFKGVKNGKCTCAHGDGPRYRTGL